MCKVKNLTKYQITVLIVLGLSNLLEAVIFSLLSPFYPPEAQRKGVSVGVAGVVVGSYAAASVIASPIVSTNILPQLKDYVTFHFGMFLTAMSILLFGFVNVIYNKIGFVTISIFLQVIGSIGSASVVVSSCTILAIVIPERVGLGGAILSASFAIGYSIGPFFGEIIYGLGEGDKDLCFSLPFLTTSLILIVFSIASMFILHPIKSRKFQEKEEQYLHEKHKGFIWLIRFPSLTLFFTTVLFCSITGGFLMATLEPLVRPFRLSNVQIGLLFGIQGFVAMITSFFWGFLCDKLNQSTNLLMFSSIFGIAQFALIQSSVGLPRTKSLFLISIGLVFAGFLTANATVVTFVLIQREVQRLGFPYTNELIGDVQAFRQTGMQLGFFIGPIIGGFLYEYFGIRIECFTAITFFIVLFIILLIVSIYFPMVGKKISETKSRIGKKDECSSEQTHLINKTEDQNISA